MVRCMVNEVQAGMVLAKAVCVQGGCLLNNGNTITAKHLQSFKAWGVKVIWIEGEGAVELGKEKKEDSGEINPKIEQINFRFSKSDHTVELIEMLKKNALSQICKHP